VFVSSHEVVRKRLRKYFLPDSCIVCVYPSIELKDEWIDKLRIRWETDLLEKHYKAYKNAVDRYEDNVNEIKNCGIPGIEITSMDYDLNNLLTNWYSQYQCESF
jgi:hypothetical protein